jgi:hypothetical protein
LEHARDRDWLSEFAAVGSVGCKSFVFPPGENRHEASSS